MLERTQFEEALTKLRQAGPKRAFVQTVDLIINLRDLDLKKPEQHVDAYVQLPHSRGKVPKVCAFVAAEMLVSAKGACDNVIINEDFGKYQSDKKKIKKLANEYDYFIAQVNLMPEIAKVFGRVLGPRGKMPNPKAGCVVAPNANIKQLVDKLRTTCRAVARTQLSVKLAVGKENIPDSELLTNIYTVYQQIVRALPSEDNNVRSVLLKLTMGAPIKIGAGEEKKVETHG